jgi:multidrug efflux pump subunit AcrB
MTLGGLALVMGRLVDDAIVDVENTVRHLDMGSPPKRAALESAMEIAMPVLVSTITTVAVFIPVIFLIGMAKYLFTPLALSVAFAMFASYILSRTISPAYCAYMLRGDSWFWQALCWIADRFAPARLLKAACQGISGAWTALHRLSEQAQGALNRWYVGSLRAALRVRYLVLLGGLAAFAASFLLYPWIGKELFPQIDAGQFVIGVRAPAGTRLENTEAITQRVEKIIQEEVPVGDRQMIVTNIGVLYDWPAGYTPNAGPMDATMLVQLTPKSERDVSAQGYADRLRERLVREVPGVQFSIDTGGLVSSALNFGLPSPINLQIEGRDMQTQFAVAKKMKDMIGGTPEEPGIPGAVDVRIQETVDYPTIDIDPDRVKMAKLGITQEDAVKNLMSALNSSTSFDPAFWLDYRSGNHYFVGVTYREKDINSLSTLEYAPITGSTGDKPRVLRDVANLKYGKAAVEVSHLNLTRVINVYANISGRDVGAVAAGIQEKMAELGPRQTSDTTKVPSWGVINRGFSAKERPDEPLAGYTVRMRGEVASMQESFTSLGSGLLLATVLIYLIMIAQFRSFLDPFIIIFAVPLGIIGVLATLFLTGTTINVQSFLGVIFMVGIAVSNSILLVEFANRLRSERGLSPREAAVEAASIRLRPILMTSLAAVIGLLPMALRSGEANTPLARAVIGGLSVSTVLTLFVVPCLYVILKRGQVAPRAEEA